jgi:hypothetical protein
MRTRSRIAFVLAAALLPASSSAFLACAKVNEGPRVTGSAGNGGGGGAGGGKVDGGAGGGGPTYQPACPNNMCADFPATPIIDPGTPADAATMFPGASSGAAPCVYEPADGALFPKGLLRPRIKWSGTTGVHRITVHADNQSRDLVAYTNKSFWMVPKDIWAALSAHTTEKDITVTVRAAGAGESGAKFQIAPVAATGSIVFWAANPAASDDREVVDRKTATELRGFGVGDEGTAAVLKVPQVQQPSAEENGIPRPVGCMGCHVATPDTSYIAFVDDWPWNLVVAGVKPGRTGMRLPGLTDGGLAALNMPWGGMMAFSKAVWAPGRRMVVLASSLADYTMPWVTASSKPAKLTWYNLDAAAPAMPGMVMPGVQFGEVARQGDSRGAAAPTWSHDGATIVYCSTQGGNQDGALAKGATDLYSVPFADGAGGPAKPLPGASDPAFEEYYPAYSPDDRLIAYNRVPAGENMYANPLSELYVLPAQGGVATRLAANDPPACTGRKSPGVNNVWGRWSPTVASSGVKRYYWLLFSSYQSDVAMTRFRDRNHNGRPVMLSQLYLTAVVQSGDSGNIQTYGGIYLWNQPTDTINATPIWEDLEIPVVQ